MLVLEFDYGQNYPLPKLRVNSQFYKRLLWLYIFNVHVFNDDSSFMYTYMETEGRKNANSVCSLVHHCIKQKMSAGVKKIVLLSDGTGGQNKNIFVVKFCAYIAVEFNVIVEHLFPVRGHSFSQCDRNFGVIRKSLKKYETIGTAKLYLEAIVTCRSTPEPFQLVHDSSILCQWDEALMPLFQPKPRSNRGPWKIQQSRRFVYRPDGLLLVSSSFNAGNYMSFSVWEKRPVRGLNLTLITSPPGEVTKAKKKDVLALLKYLPKKDRRWIRNLLK